MTSKRRLPAGAVCDMEDCEYELSPFAILPTCRNCRASIHGWERKHPSALLERQRKLKLYQHRMEFVTPRGRTTKGRK